MGPAHSTLIGGAKVRAEPVGLAAWLPRARAAVLASLAAGLVVLLSFVARGDLLQFLQSPVELTVTAATEAQVARAADSWPTSPRVVLPTHPVPGGAWKVCRKVLL